MRITTCVITVAVTVGIAALLAADGLIYVGANVENLSFGLTMCAERIAVGAAVAAGAQRFLGIAIVSESLEPIVPCGACRQVLSEFCDELEIWSRSLNSGMGATFLLTELLPRAHQGILDHPRST